LSSFYHFEAVPYFVEADVYGFDALLDVGCFGSGFIDEAGLRSVDAGQDGDGGDYGYECDECACDGYVCASEEGYELPGYGVEAFGDVYVVRFVVVVLCVFRRWDYKSEAWASGRQFYLVVVAQVPLVAYYVAVNEGWVDVGDAYEFPSFSFFYDGGVPAAYGGEGVFKVNAALRVSSDFYLVESYCFAFAYFVVFRACAAFEYVIWPACCLGM
jgi:hypothetical protein